MSMSNTIFVDMGDNEFADEPDDIETSGLGTCIGIVIYNTKTKRAFVGHFIDPSLSNDDQIDDLVNMAKNSGPLEDLKVWVGGGQVDHDDGPEAIEYDLLSRSAALEKLEDRGFSSSQIEVRWKTDSEISFAMCMSTATGEMRYEIHKILDDDVVGEDY